MKKLSDYIQKIMYSDWFEKIGDIIMFIIFLTCMLILLLYAIFGLIYFIKLVI